MALPARFSAQKVRGTSEPEAVKPRTDKRSSRQQLPSGKIACGGEAEDLNRHLECLASNVRN
jgi:hypothetical protein